MAGYAPDEKKPRMGVNAVVDSADSRWTKASQLFAAGGYGELKGEVQEIHCQAEQYKWIENGFLQTYDDVGGEKARILIYFPGQVLQPHKHDLAERFVITFGWVDLWTWDETGKACLKVMKKGDIMEVPTGTNHALRVGTQGLTFHETVGADAFAKRSTEWLTGTPMPSIFQEKTVFITGANRGLGKGFAEFFEKEGARVVGTCRSPSSSNEIPLDISDPASVAALPERLKAAGVEGVDYLINNAGISVPNHPVDPIVGLDINETRKVFETNILGTVSVTNALLPFLTARSSRVCVTLSSQLASIENCFGVQGKYGGVASYRMARTALNMAMRCFAGELKDDGYVFISMSPGHVATDMGSAGGRVAPLTVAQSIGGMLDVMRTLTSDSNGAFLQYDHAVLPW